MFRYPMLARVLKILLCVDFDVTARRIDVTESLTLLDHVLKQQNLVRVFEIACVTPWLAGEFVASPLVVFTQPLRTSRREFRNADVFTVGILLKNLAIDARD